jgi:23S rRNA (cytosine1962-C5)-methyltransferase
MTESTSARFPRLVLAKGREKSLLRRHPWVFSGAVSRMEGKARLGETIDIVDAQGKWLARGAFSPESQIRARVWTFDKDELIDIAFLPAACSRHSNGVTGWQSATGWTVTV